ncbi:MAG: division/cell wall cluster transcriptional repressor MraZ [Lachnospiraceae bacterium]|nr:division/cell wall cluster transcriptional repressor MraZ [Lachnospiraceae bacterium]
MNYIGEYNHSIDAKGRLIIPAKYREGLGESFMITKGLEGCLYLQENYDFEATVDKLSAQSNMNPKVRKMKRFYLGGAQEVELDKTGRILVPGVLREYAGLDKEVVFVGVGDRVEIWPKETWEEISDFGDIDKIAEELADLGID